MIKWDAIKILSDIRSEYNCFDERDEDQYHALSLAIEMLRNRPIKCDECRYWISSDRESGWCDGIPMVGGDDMTRIETLCNDSCSYGERKEDDNIF